MGSPLFFGQNFVLGSPAIYFGGCNSDGTPLATDGQEFFTSLYIYNNTAVTIYTCPGTGARTIDVMGVYGQSGGVTPGHLRMAVYSNDISTLICTGAAILVNVASLQWWDTSSFTGSTSLTGGASYVIAVTTDSADTRLSYESLTNTSQESFGTSYVGGFPAPLSGGSPSNKVVNTRIHLISS